jgi:seryl-tRNA synthetase
MNLKTLRENPDEVRRILVLRRCEVDVDRMVGLDEQRRKLAAERDESRHRQKQVSKDVAAAKREGRECPELYDDAKKLSARVKGIEAELSGIETELDGLVGMLPNRVHESVTAEEEVVGEWGEKPVFDFQPLAHWDLGEALDILDLKAAANLAGSRFPLFKGQGALLRRALLNFFLDTDTRNGYTEVSPPVLVKAAALRGSGQLPHLEEDMYALRDDPHYLIPTSEAVLANMHQGQTLQETDLPLKYVACTPCFRREAGSYGKDVRGITRVHQFDKAEIVRLTRPEGSYDALEEMLVEACALLRELGIPYRVKRLAAWDIAYQAAKTYDIEVWAAGEERWLEVSSVSNCEDYQARRSKTRFRTADGRSGFPHILNGSALALPRTFIALIENNQQPDGSVVIPEVLRPYMGGLERIS